MSTIFATKSYLVDGDVYVFWDATPAWQRDHWYGEGGDGFPAYHVKEPLFRVLFGCATVPSAEECWEFAAGGFEHRCWLRSKIHTPPKPEPEPRTWTMEEIKDCFLYEMGRSGWMSNLERIEERLEALPRKEPHD